MCLCCEVEPELLDTVDMDEGPKPQTCPRKVAEVDWALLATQISELSAGNKLFTGVDSDKCCIHRLYLHLCLYLLSCPICFRWPGLVPFPCEVDVPCSPSLA